MDRETRVPPGKQPFRPFRTEKLPPDQERQDLPGEDIGQPRVVDMRDFALGSQKMEVRMKAGQEALEMVEEHPVEDGPLRMSGTIDSRHGGRRASRNGPRSWR
jgi:hypothetical protein